MCINNKVWILSQYIFIFMYSSYLIQRTMQTNLSHIEILILINDRYMHLVLLLVANLEVTMIFCHLKYITTFAIRVEISCGERNTSKMVKVFFISHMKRHPIILVPSSPESFDKVESRFGRRLLLNVWMFGTRTDTQDSPGPRQVERWKAWKKTKEAEGLPNTYNKY